MRAVGALLRSLPECAMARSLWRRAGVKRARRAVVAAAVLAPAVCFVPMLALFTIVCGVIDVRRRKHITCELLEKYVLGNGFLAWMPSPLNLLADLHLYGSCVISKLEDMPADRRREIETSCGSSSPNGDRIKAHAADSLWATASWRTRAVSRC